MMKLRVFVMAVLAVLFADSASASWYSSLYAHSKKWMWPFGGTNEMNGVKGPRLSTLMEPASRKIDEANDLINEGKTDEAVERYREALRLLEELEGKYPERAASPEFQSVRNKRAYVDAQLNAILLEEARVNAKAVAVSDTTELELKLKKKRREEAEVKKKAEAEKKTFREKKSDETVPKDSSAKPKLENQLDEYMEDERARAKKISRAATAARFDRESEEQIKKLLAANPESRKARVMRAGLELSRKNYGIARKDLDELLKKNPNDISALNLLAAVETATGNYTAAEEALAKAIRADEKDYHAYYNLAKLLYRRSDGKDKVRADKFYRRGRKAGGPVDTYLERVLK